MGEESRIEEKRKGYDRRREENGKQEGRIGEESRTKERRDG